METGLLLFRVVVGLLFIGHGTQKLYGWFGGGGPDGTAEMFDSVGYRQPRTMAMVAGTAEAVAGALLVLGLFTPLAGAAIIGVMLNAAVTVHRPNGLWSSDGGYEYPLVNATAGAMLAFTGAGALSLDGAFGLPLAGVGWGFAAILLGLLVGAGTLTMRESPEPARRREPRTRPGDEMPAR